MSELQGESSTDPVDPAPGASSDPSPGSRALDAAESGGAAAGAATPYPEPTPGTSAAALAESNGAVAGTAAGAAGWSLDPVPGTSAATAAEINGAAAGAEDGEAKTKKKREKPDMVGLFQLVSLTFM